MFRLSTLSFSRLSLVPLPNFHTRALTAPHKCSLSTKGMILGVVCQHTPKNDHSRKLRILSHSRVAGLPSVTSSKVCTTTKFHKDLTERINRVTDFSKPHPKGFNKHRLADTNHTGCHSPRSDTNPIPTQVSKCSLVRLL